MNANDLIRFTEAWGVAFELCRAEASPAATTAAFKILERFSIEAVCKALEDHINDPEAGMFPPHPAHIVGMIEGKPEDRAIEAWAAVLPEMRGGTDNFLVFDDEIIHKVVKEMGGFKYLGSGTEPTHYLAMRFKENYVAVARSPQENRNCPPRIYYYGNGVFGPNSTVRYIGDKRKCLMIEQKAEKAESLEWMGEATKLISSDNELPF